MFVATSLFAPQSRSLQLNRIGISRQLGEAMVQLKHNRAHALGIASE